MRDEYRLRAPQMRIRGHQRLANAFRLIGECRNQLDEPLLKQRYPATQVETQVERYLLVARPPGMEPPARVANTLDQFPFDEAVDVLVFAGTKRRSGAPFFKNRFHTSSDGGSILFRQHAACAKRLRPREAARDVVFKQRPIETERNAEVEGSRIGLCIETTGPESHE